MKLYIASEIKSTQGNINLFISIDEIHNIIRAMPNYPKNPKLIYQLKKITNNYGEYYEISNDGENKEVIFNQDELLNLLNAPMGLYSLRDSEMSNDIKFRIELKKSDEYWKIDTGESQ